MPNIKLVPIEQNMALTDIADATLKINLQMTMDFYRKVGFKKPWISYLAYRGEECAGTCAFKGKPIDNKVEIAYCTLPHCEGQGIATKMCALLVEMAQNEDDDVLITARTLPEENASTNILRKNGFTLVGTVNDPEDGDVYEWVKTV